MKFKVAFNIWIDQETHPQISTKQSAIEIAQSLTLNQVGGFDWDSESKGLLFKEYVFFEAPTDDDDDVCDGIEKAKLQCKCPEPEFCYVQRVRS